MVTEGYVKTNEGDLLAVEFILVAIRPEKLKDIEKFVSMTDMNREEFFFHSIEIGTTQIVKTTAETIRQTVDFPITIE